jgi:hypothetical protein
MIRMPLGNENGNERRATFSLSLLRSHGKILKIALLCLLTGITVALGTLLRQDHPVDIRMVNTAQVGTTKNVTVELRPRTGSAVFAHDLRVENRVGGRWQPPTHFLALSDTYLVAEGSCQRVLFTVSPETEACRFLLEYRLGQRPYCQMYFFLAKHGVMKRFPALSRLVLKCVPQQSRLRHLEWELMV